MTPQPGMRPQFPTPAITKQQEVGAMGGTQNTAQQLPMQHLQQAVKLPASLSQAQGQGQVFDQSGLTQQQLDVAHLPFSNLQISPGGVLPYITYTGMCRPKGS